MEDKYEPFSDRTTPEWKVKVDQYFPQQTRKSSAITTEPSKEIRSILKQQVERKKVLDKRVRFHEHLVEMERVERIKDRLTMPTHRERIMECR